MTEQSAAGSSSVLDAVDQWLLLQQAIQWQHRHSSPSAQVFPGSMNLGVHWSFQQAANKHVLAAGMPEHWKCL